MPGNQPAGLTHFDDRHQCPILLKGGEGSAQVVRLRLRHGALSVGVSSDDAATFFRRPLGIAQTEAGARVVETILAKIRRALPG